MKISARIKKIFIPVLIVVIFGAAIIFLVTGKKKEEVSAAELPVVVVQKPEIKDLQESITISGYVEAEVMIPVVPFVSGTIMEYNAKAGEYVEKDTVLAVIDDAPFKQTMLQAQAAYFAAQSTFDRIENLYKAGSATQQNYDSARAQRDANKAQYDLAKLQMDYTRVKAPVNGTVLIADLAAGSIGTQSAPVAVLADLTKQVVRLKVPEKYYDLFNFEKEKLKVTVTRPAQKGMYEDAVTTAGIENIAPYISPESKNFIVVCSLDEPGERFRPGMFVKVKVAYRNYEQVPVLPIETKKMDGSCYIYDRETESVKYLMLGDSPSDDNYFVLPDEYKDTYFVTDGQNTVFDGQKVVLYEKVLEEY